MWQNYPELTLALQVFSSCEVFTDIINNHMPVLKKFLNDPYDVTDADAPAFKAFEGSFFSTFLLSLAEWTCIEQHFIFCIVCGYLSTSII